MSHFYTVLPSDGKRMHIPNNIKGYASHQTAELPSGKKGVFLRIFEKKEEFAKNKKSLVILTGRMPEQEYQK